MKFSTHLNGNDVQFSNRINLEFRMNLHQHSLTYFLYIKKVIPVLKVFCSILT